MEWKVLTKTGWSNCDLLKAWWPSGLRRQTQEILLWDFWYTNVCVGSNPIPVKFCGRKTNILFEAIFLRGKFRARQSRFYTTRRCNRKQTEAIAKYEEAGWPSGLRRQTQEILIWDFWYTNGCAGSNPTPVKFCIQKAKTLVEAVFLRVKSGARRSRFHITRRCYRRQNEASATQTFVYQKSQRRISWVWRLRPLGHPALCISHWDINKAGWPSGLRRQTQEILLWDFWYTNVCVGSNPTPVKFCFRKTNIFFEAVFLRGRLRARQSRFYTTRRCNRKQIEAIAKYDFWRQDGRAV